MIRENAIKQLKRMKIDMSHTGDEYNAIVEAIRALEQVPTDDATLRDIFCMGCEYKEQEPKTGEWQQDMDGTYLCSECGSGYKDQPTLMGKPMFAFCPICGCRMIKGADE